MNILYLLKKFLLETMECCNSIAFLNSSSVIGLKLLNGFFDDFDSVVEKWAKVIKSVDGVQCIHYGA